MSYFRSYTQLKQDTDDSDRPSRSSSRTSTIEPQYHKLSRQSIQSISNSSEHTNVSVNDKGSLRVSRNFSVSASSSRDPSVFDQFDHKSTYSLAKSAFRHRNQSQSTIRTGLEVGSSTLPTAPSTPSQRFSPLSAPFNQDNVSSSAGYTYHIAIPSSSPPPADRIDSASHNSNKWPEIGTSYDPVPVTHIGFNPTREFTGLSKEWQQPPTCTSPQGSGITKSNQEENPPAPGSSQSPPIPGTAQPAPALLFKSVDDSDSSIPTVSRFSLSFPISALPKQLSLSPPKKAHSLRGTPGLSVSHASGLYRPAPSPAQPVQPDLDQSSSQRTVSKAQRNDTLRAITTKDRCFPAPPATVKASKSNVDNNSNSNNNNNNT
jgi:hypothetical protein